MKIDKGKWRDTVEYAAASDVGMRRGNNQDAYVVALAGSRAQWLHRGHIVAVADGMGAHAAGELASQMAIDNIPHTYYKLLRYSYPVAIQKAVLEANSLIHSKGQGSIDFHGMGTTCSVLLLLSEGAVVAHVGDSRIYRLRGDTLEQLTFDHSLVWEMAEAGHISEEQVPKCIPKNVITRSLGPHQTVEVDLEGPFPLQEGDVFLLCSDGLTGPVNDVELGTLLNCLSTEEAIHTLVDLANLRGGPDNITLAAIKIKKTDQKEVEEDAEAEASYSTPGSVHSVVWGALAVLLVIGLVFLALNKWVPATAAGIGILIATAIAFFQRQEKPRETQPIHGPLGKGPYRAFNCKPSQETVEALEKITVELCEVVNSPDWDVDAAEFETLRQEGVAAAKQEQLTLAIQKYSAAIRAMMEQVREQRRISPSDSNVLG